MVDNVLILGSKEQSYISTIAYAAEHGTVSKEGVQVIGLLMRGWTLHSAKHKVYVEDVRGALKR